MKITAQEGDYLLNHFKPRGLDIDLVHFDILQDNNGMMYFANRKGVVRFDGYIWELIPTNGAVFSLSLSSDNEIVTLGAGGVGIIKRDLKGKFNYHHIALPEKYNDNLKKIHVKNDKLWFLSDSTMVSFSIFNQEIINNNLFPNGEKVLDFFMYPDGSYIQFEDRGLFEWADEKIGRQVIGFPKEEELIYLGSNTPDKPKIALSNDGKIFRLENNRLHRLVFNSDLNMDGLQLMQAKWIDDEILAISTLRNGILLINPYQVKVVKSINYSNGLPDNEIFAITTDSDKGLWMAHEFGFSRLAINLPLKTFSHYPGLYGNLLDTENHKDKVYVATSLGLYYLDKVDTYITTVYYEKKKTSKPKVTNKPHAANVPEPQEKIAETSTESEKETSEKKGKGIFSFLKKNKGDTPKKEEVPEEKEKQGVIAKIFSPKTEEEEVIPVAAAKNDDVYIRKERKELQATNYVYKKVSGLAAKVKQVHSNGNLLLAATHSGIYQINDSTAQLIDNNPVNHLFYDSESNLLFANTLFDELIVLEKRGDMWIKRTSLPIKEAVTYIFKDEKGWVWFNGSRSIFNYKIEDGIEYFGSYPVENPYFQPIGTIYYKNQLIFLINHQYWTFDQAKNTLVRNHELEEVYGVYTKFFQQEKDFVWIKNAKSWNLAGTSPFENIYLEYLSLFQNINCISYDPIHKLIWVIDEEKTLYRFDIQESSPFLSSSKLFLREIRDQEGKTLPARNLSISQLDSYLQFEFSQPDFLGMLGVEYSYYLEGLSKEWSDWSSSNVISFQYLPPGNYRLNVKTRNNFGQIQERDVIEFAVSPPFWQTWWFYALEVLFFSMLLVVSVRINNTKWKDSVISRVLGFFTLVLIVESLQALGGSFFENESLVIEFAINIAIAFLILPVEGIIRKYIIDKEVNAMIKDAKPKTINP